MYRTEQLRLHTGSWTHIVHVQPSWLYPSSPAGAQLSLESVCSQQIYFSIQASNSASFLCNFAVCELNFPSHQTGEETLAMPIPEPGAEGIVNTMGIGLP